MPACLYRECAPYARGDDALAIFMTSPLSNLAEVRSLSLGHAAVAYKSCAKSELEKISPRKQHLLVGPYQVTGST